MSSMEQVRTTAGPKAEAIFKALMAGLEVAGYTHITVYKKGNDFRLACRDDTGEWVLIPKYTGIPKVSLPSPSTTLPTS